jgi:arylsulfatase A-like enzyme
MMNEPMSTCLVVWRIGTAAVACSKRVVLAAAVLFHCIVGVASAAEAETSHRLNVLWIMVDDLRPALGCYGDPDAITPNIDRLASTARVFRRAYCHQSVCGPSRTSILTGMLPDNSRVWHNRNLFRHSHPEWITLPQLFKLHGYHAESLGKVFSGNQKELDPASWSVPEVLRVRGSKNYLLPENAGSGKQAPMEFAEVSDDAYPDGKLAELAVDALHRFDRNQTAFFLAVGFFKPHLPFTAPRKYLDMHAADKFVQPMLSRPDGSPEHAYPDHLELAGYRNIPKDERVSAERAIELRRAYYACVTYVDAQVGKLLDALHTTGLDQSTVVVLLGDHGFSLGEFDHWCKDTNFETDTRVPVMIRTPNMPHPGHVTDALTEYVDLYPTLAQLAGLQVSRKLDGRSLVPVIQDPLAAGRDVVLSQFSRPFKPTRPQVMGYSIRSAEHRYTRWIDWLSEQVLAEELYDYASPQSVARHQSLLIERQNVASECPELLLHMRGQMDRLLESRVRTDAGRRDPASDDSSRRPSSQRRKEK